MADEPVKPTAQIYKLTSAGSLRKDLGPNGINNPGSAVQPNAFEPEDEYQQLYVGATRDQGIIQPPFSLRQLDRLSLENNALGPCIETMVTNVDGTGYDFESEDEDAEDTTDDSNINKLTEFFAEPWPGMSFSTIRKLLRRDLERTGNGDIEVLRNAQDEIVFFRHVDAKMMRMLRLDDAVPVDQTVIRDGKPVTIKVMTRERRYCQLVNGVSLMYFKEFGSKRDLHKKTAVWAPQGQRLPANMRATEIMHFTVLPDSHTPYGIPRWVTQLPSVLGSRKAEEFNLDFFDNGGIPPVIILLQGGTLQAETRKALTSMTTGEATRNNRVQVLEVETTTGTVDSSAQARVTVERFGCHSADTEVLTEDGWRLFNEWDGALLATVNLGTGALEYQAPTGGLQVYPYAGDMIEFPGAAHNALVTPNHKMVREAYDGSWVREQADKMEKRARAKVMVAPAYVQAYDHETFQVAGRDFASTAFLKFLGHFIADGSTTTDKFRSNNAIKLSVKKERKIDAIMEWCDVIGLPQTTCLDATGHTIWTFMHAKLRSWLRVEVGTYSHNKRIPRDFLRLSTAQSQILLMALFDGDAHHVNKGGRNSYTYTTVSPQLADDVQELGLRCGWRATIGDDGRGALYVSIVPGKNYASLSHNKIKNTSFSRRVPYDGNVYCFEVPNHTIVTRRNGRVAIHGNSERQKDSMFELYDKNCEERVRRSFRIPPIFIGQSKDFNFATAFASYVVAEAQVFKPERDAFDELISMRLVTAMGYDGYRLRSKPLVIEDATLKLQGIEIAMGIQQVEPADVIEAVNQAVGVHLKVSPDAPTLKDQLQPQVPPGATHTIDANGQVKPINPSPVDPARGGARPPSAPGAKGQNPGALPKPITPALLGSSAQGMQPGGGTTPIAKSDVPLTALDLAMRAMTALRKRDFTDLAFNLSIIRSLDEEGVEAFNEAATGLAFVDTSFDPEGLADLACCTMAVMSGQFHSHAN